MHTAVDRHPNPVGGGRSAPAFLHLRSGGTSVVLAMNAHSIPTIVHWGADLGDVESSAIEAMAVAAVPQAVSGGLDRPARATLIPQNSDGWLATPAVNGERNDRHFSPAFVTVGIESSTQTAEITMRDDDAGLEVLAELRVTSSGLFSQRLRLTNVGEDGYALHDLATTFPVPASARELLDTTGRHLRERSPQRHAFTIGRHLRESRRGRPGADATLVLAAGTPGFGFERGLVHAVHVAWSGNHRLSAERTSSSEAVLQAGELLLPGEIDLAPGETYLTPWCIGSWGDGLTAASARFHEYLRGRPRHPASARPVTLNTWEAVYFEHDLDRLLTLADSAAAIGVERFVLDDGWFLGRRDDTSGLGDWVVDPVVWPHGLGPLVDAVTARGMQFGLWVEPEMVNLESEIAREHPDWILGTPGRLPVPGRNQQVLDISRADVWQYLLERLDALLTEYDIAYLKWDHNRDLLEPAGSDGRPAVHRQVEALYRLMDELTARHPGLEIESCASGGARVDLGILEHTQRIWGSDCIDPVERLQIQKYTGLVVPPELVGSHVASQVSHSTGRAHSLDLRAGVAMFGHFGIEWDISRLSGAETDRLAEWISAYKRWRELIATGRVVHADLPDAEGDLRGVIARDGARALFAYTQVRSSITNPPGRITFPGLDDEGSYAIGLAAPITATPGPGQSALQWTERATVMTGRQFGIVGVQAPALHPEQQVVFEFTATSRPDDQTHEEAP